MLHELGYILTDPEGELFIDELSMQAAIENIKPRKDFYARFLLDEDQAKGILDTLKDKRAQLRPATQVFVDRAIIRWVTWDPKA